MQYSQVEGLFPRKEKTKLLANYYEGIKNEFPSERMHHYWLQYAISRIAMDDYEKAGVFLDSAYDMAKKNKKDPYYIDNHRARFLLKKSLHRGDAAGTASTFRQAHPILIGR